MLMKSIGVSFLAVSVVALTGTLTLARDPAHVSSNTNAAGNRQVVAASGNALLATRTAYSSFPYTPRLGVPNTVGLPLYFTGRVVISDGSRLTSPVRVDRVCDEFVIPEGQTDLEGRFTIMPGYDALILADISVPYHLMRVGGFTGLGARDLERCEIRAYLPGFRSESAMLIGAQSHGIVSLGTITLHRHRGIPGTAVSRTSADLPKRAWKAFRRAEEHIAHERYEDAERDFAAATRLAPSFAAAWFRLGLLLEDESLLARAVEIDPDFIPSYEALMILAARRASWGEVLTWTDEVMARNPDEFPRSHYYRALAHLAGDDLAAAESDVRRAIELGWHRTQPETLDLLAEIEARTADVERASR